MSVMPTGRPMISPTTLPSGALRLVRCAPNPVGAQDTGLFLFVGDATATPIERIIPDPGVALPARRASLDTRPFRLKILHFNDLHGHVCQLTRQGHLAVFSRIARWLRETRAGCRGNPHAAVLVMTAGDDLVGTVFDELLGDDPGSYIAHASYRLYSAAGVDVGVLGNHDLDMGVRLLRHALYTDARFPVLSANIAGCSELADCYYPAALFVVKGVRVGLIGLTTPAEVKPLSGSDLVVAHPIQVAHNILPAIRPLCDVVIVLSHLGYSLASSKFVRDAGDVELAQNLSRHAVHLIVGGHTHFALNEQGLSADNIVNGVPIVQAGKLGQFVGEVNITVQREASVTNAWLIPTADLPDDEAFEQEHVKPLLARARSFYGRSLGRAADHEDVSSDAVRNAFAARESALVNFIADALVTQSCACGHPVDIAIVDASCVRTGLPVGGELTFGDWFEVMPFADTLCTRRMTGAQLKALIRDNALRVDRPGEPHTERGFVHFSSRVRYAILLGNGRREAQAVDITVDGLPIDTLLERSFLVACSAFLRELAATWENHARSAPALPLFDIREIPFTDTRIFVRKLLVEYISAHGGVTEAAGVRRDGRLQVICDDKEPIL